MVIGMLSSGGKKELNIHVDSFEVDMQRAKLVGKIGVVGYFPCNIYNRKNWSLAGNA